MGGLVDDRHDCLFLRFERQVQLLTEVLKRWNGFSDVSWEPFRGPGTQGHVYPQEIRP